MSADNRKTSKIIIIVISVFAVIAVGILGFTAYRKFFDSAYQKMDDGFRVKMLVVGDSIGYGAGASDESHYWSNLVSYYVQDRYGCPVTMVNVSLGGNTSYAGYVRTLTPDEDRVYYALEPMTGLRIWVFTMRLSSVPLRVCIPGHRLCLCSSHAFIKSRKRSRSLKNWQSIMACPLSIQSLPVRQNMRNIPRMAPIQMMPDIRCFLRR